MKGQAVHGKNYKIKNLTDCFVKKGITGCDMQLLMIFDTKYART